MRKLTLLRALALTFTISSAFAISEKPYITVGDVDFSSLLPPPPPEDSLAGKRDLQTVLDLQKNMTPERMAAIQADVALTVYQVAGEVLGPNFTKVNFPMTGDFLAKAWKDAGGGVGPVKQKYKKLRPFQYSKEVQTPENIAKNSGSPTYPSGHSTFGALVAVVMGMMVPEKREALYARGWEYGINRITSGAAYPSDWEGGHISATLAVNQMMKNPEFRADYEAAKAEVRKGLGLP